MLGIYRFFCLYPSWIFIGDLAWIRFTQGCRGLCVSEFTGLGSSFA